MNDQDRTEFMRTPPQRVAPRPSQPPLLAPPSILQPTDDWEDEDSSRARKVWGFVGIGVLCLALLAGAIYFTLRITGAPPPAAKVSVPNVTKMSPDDATAALRAKNLTVAQPLLHKDSTDAQKGTVILQDPSEGTIVDQDTPVTLTIGDGVQQVTVPNVLHEDAQQAQKDIQAKNLVYREEKIYSSAIKGTVASQKPDAGATAKPGDVVTVQISQGPQMTVIPAKGDLIGKDVKDAEAALTNAQLKFVPQSQASDKPKNQVLTLGPGQSPGDQVQVGTVVTLIVSDNSMMKMPDLSNQKPEQALATLKNLGWSGNANSLTQTPKEDKNQALWGYITAQQPTANKVVAKDSVINVTVATEPKIAMPDLSGKTLDQVKAALSEAGWVPGQLVVVTENGQTPPKGQGETVIQNSQSPTANDEILMTATITIHMYPKEVPPTTSSSPPASSTGTTGTSTAETTSSSSDDQGGGGGGGGPGRGNGGPGNGHGGGGG
jgi:serine/threonine-protein kinase